MGAGAIQPTAMTVLGDIYTPAERAKVQGYSSSVFGVSAILGPALGAFIVEHMHWSGGVLGQSADRRGEHDHVRAVPARRVEALPREQRIDYIGAALLTVGVGAVLLTLVQAATLGARGIAAMAAVAVAAFALLVVQERPRREPIDAVQAVAEPRSSPCCHISGIFGTGVGDDDGDSARSCPPMCKA